MDFLQLKYFKTVAECQSVTKASQILYVAQPHLSTKIRELERELDVALFERQNRRMYLSPAGQVFLEHIIRMDNELETALAKLDQMKNENAERERITVAATSCGLFQPIIERFSSQNRKLAVSHLIMSNRQLLEGLQEGRIEFGLVCESPDNTSIDYAPIFVEELVVVMSQELHPEIEAECNIEQLRRDSVMINSMLVDEEFIVSLCRKAGFTPNIAFFTNEITVEHLEKMPFREELILFLPVHCLSTTLSESLLEHGLKVVHLRDYFATLTWGLAFSKSAVFTFEKERFFKYADKELSALAEQLAKRYGNLKNYKIQKAISEKDFQ